MVLQNIINESLQNTIQKALFAPELDFETKAGRGT